MDRIRRYADDTQLAGKPISAWDCAGLLRLMTENWFDAFHDTLGYGGRSLASELRDWRNRWAHQETFSNEDAYRVVDSVERLLTAAAADKQTERAGAMRAAMVPQIEAVAVHAGTSRPGVLPITLSPAPARAFKEALLQTRRAVIRVTYVDGRVEEQTWYAGRISEESSVIGNLRSRPSFRAGAWQRKGIASVEVHVQNAAGERAVARRANALLPEAAPRHYARGGSARERGRRKRRHGNWLGTKLQPRLTKVGSTWTSPVTHGAIWA